MLEWAVISIWVLSLSPVHVVVRAPLGDARSGGRGLPAQHIESLDASISTRDPRNQRSHIGLPTGMACTAAFALRGRSTSSLANIGVHGLKVDLHLGLLWSQNIAITTRLVDTVTTPMLLKTVQSKKIDPARLITHRLTFDQILDAYDTFGRAAQTHALRVINAA